MDKEINRKIKELQLEIEGIREVIRSYTGEGLVNNYTKKLSEALNMSEIDIKDIKFCLNNLVSWYSGRIEDMKKNSHIYYKAAHISCYEKLKNYKKVFDELEDSEVIFIDTEKKVENKNKGPIIFISHKSDDKKYGDALRNFIIGLGVKNEQLIYTSHELNKIPLDNNIYEYLRNNINANVFMIILWSDAYLESPACLNEMGAVWVLQGDYTNMYVPSFSFGNPKYHECAVDTRKMGAVLNGDKHCKAAMIEFKDKIQNIFGLKNNEKEVNSLLDTFIEEITGE